LHFSSLFFWVLDDTPEPHPWGNPHSGHLCVAILLYKGHMPRFGV
jgi:hypothetical protein